MEPYRDRAAPGCGGSVCEMVGSCMAVGADKSVVNWRRSLAAGLCNFFFSHSYSSTMTPSDMPDIVLNTSYDRSSFSRELHQLSGIVSLLLLGKMRHREGHALFQVHTSSE